MEVQGGQKIHVFVQFELERKGGKIMCTLHPAQI